MRKLVGLLVAVAACGDDGVHHLADAPPTADGGVDSMIDAMPLPVTLTVTQNGAPVAGVKVYFQAPDSTEISSIATDETGVASAMMPHGGFVTAVDPFVSAATPTPTLLESHDLKTWANVKPGDHLTLTDTFTTAAPPVVTVTVATDAADPVYYDVYTNCGRNYNYIYVPPAGGGSAAVPITTPDTLDMTLSGCGATADFLVITQDANYLPLNYYVVPNVAIVDGGTVDLTAGTYVGTASHTYAVSNAPAALTDLYYNVDFATAAGLFNTSQDDTYGYAGLETGAGSAPIYLPTIAGSVPIEELDLSGTTYGNHQLFRWGATPDADGNFAYDLATTTLLDFAELPAYDQPTNKIGWTTSPGATPDLYVLGFSNERLTGNGSAGPDTLDLNWTIAGAFSGPSITLPTLPGDAATFNAAAGDSPRVNNLSVAKPPGGYDAIRAHIFDLEDPSTLVAGTSGHFELASVSNNAEKARSTARKRSIWTAPKHVRTKKTRAKRR